MFFRFGAAVVLIVVIALCGIALEKRSLELRRVISQQVYRTEQLHEQRARLRTRCQQLGAPSRLLPFIEAGDLNVRAVSTADATLRQ